MGLSSSDYARLNSSKCNYINMCNPNVDQMLHVLVEQGCIQQLHVCCEVLLSGKKTLVIKIQQNI